jgi:hypothetical protein
MTRSRPMPLPDRGGGASFLSLPPSLVPVMRLFLVALASGLICTGSAAQDRIYKVQLPDGRILFTDSPPPGAKIVSERDVPPPPPPPPAAPDRDKQLRALRQQAEEAGDRSRDRSAQIEQAFAAVQQAEADVETARQQLQAGREPQPGERIGTARGGTRLTPAYEQRIAGLEGAIIAAEQRLAKARSDLNALR